jgi:hypothetical protein
MTESFGNEAILNEELHRGGAEERRARGEEQGRIKNRE